jgi:hypothetical protein
MLPEERRRNPRLLAWEDVKRQFLVTACAVVPSRENSNRTNHCRVAWWSACTNFHLLAAWPAMRAKYLLGPGFSRTSLTTVPDGSTVTRTVTFTWP